jgi:hypothetical protein
MDADGETCTLQTFGSANAAKERAQCRLLSFATSEPDSRGLSLLAKATSEKVYKIPSPQSSPRKRREVVDHVAWDLQILLESTSDS